MICIVFKCRLCFLFLKVRVFGVWFVCLIGFWEGFFEEEKMFRILVGIELIVVERRRKGVRGCILV